MYLSVDSRKWFYNAYILPHVDYSCVVWGNCSRSLEEKLVRFQKRAAIIILDCDYSVSSFVLFSKFRWMTFPERVIYQKAKQMFKTIRGEAPDYLQTFSLSIRTYIPNCYGHYLYISSIRP